MTVDLQLVPWQPVLGQRIGQRRTQGGNSLTARRPTPAAAQSSPSRIAAFAAALPLWERDYLEL
jgi:hypothetical protein